MKFTSLSKQVVLCYALSTGIICGHFGGAQYLHVQVQGWF
jgi:hypothetical protein